MIDWREPQSVIRLFKPKTVTSCNCHSDVYDEVESPSQTLEYKLCMISLDRKVALYSTTGNSLEILENRDWIVREKWYQQTEPLLLNCHDPKAFQ